ncbi:hypothetical protein CSOJ01_13930 [Colletotrichum sojae]|uniref:Uncharacterized protein n=1 Tax=Colletotrichum sojae TaxID=2175907 RepID=A0A8H6MKH5_9PEZI|nr:hypothetical protein CSOJ01_13930 [Colletotrichum sojae]
MANQNNPVAPNNEHLYFVNNQRWWNPYQPAGQQNRQPDWNFYSNTPFSQPPHAGPGPSSLPVPPPGYFPSFPSLPMELRNMIFDADVATEEPVMRFVALRQSVIHVPGCTAHYHCACFVNRPNYITFHPLYRSDLVHLGTIHGSENWVVLYRSTNRPSREQVSSYTNSERRGNAHHARGLNPFPQQQGDWSLTQIRQDQRDANVVGEPQRCNPQDLVFVHVPTDRDPNPLYTFGMNHPFVAFDPMLQDLTVVAMYIENWEFLVHDRNVERAHDRMRRGRAWERVRDHGLANIIHHDSGAPWPPADVAARDPWIPHRPQRELLGVQPPPAAHNVAALMGGQIPAQQIWWEQNVRLLTDVFTSLRHLWLVDFDLFRDTPHHLLDRYRNTPCRTDDYCEECKYSHPGHPQVWGGLSEVEFIEVRVCHEPWKELDYLMDMYFSGFSSVIRGSWPDRDANGNPMLRQPPGVGIVAPIWRTTRAEAGADTEEMSE